MTKVAHNGNVSLSDDYGLKYRVNWAVEVLLKLYNPIAI